jgi:predicted XRE-type DNA-binding protein
VSKRIKAEKSSGNVFADLKIPDAEEALAKSGLAYQIALVIEKKGLTQTAAAKLLNIDQPKVSALLRGKLTGFSTDRLFRFLNALGRDVEIVIKPSRRNHAGVRVVAA